MTINLQDEGLLRMAFNNDIVYFASSTTGLPLVRAEVTINSTVVTLYPSPNRVFFINLKNFVATLINTNRFTDVLFTDIQTPAPSSFIYDYTYFNYLVAWVEFKIFISDNTEETETKNLTWIAGVEQHGYMPMMKNGLYVLSPFKKLTNNQYYLKYWEGYPFDMPLYVGQNWEYITLSNKTTGYDVDFQNPFTISRIFISDGRTDFNLEDILPLVEGHNQLELNDSADGNRKYIQLEKIPYKCGVYLKWLNKYGCYSYWLFENTVGIERIGRYQEALANDFENLSTSLGREIQTGRETQDTLKIVAELLTEDEMTILEGLFDSPKIYLFTGQPMARNNFNNWLEVSLKSPSTRIKNYKQGLTNIAIDIELPMRYTQVL